MSEKKWYRFRISFTAEVEGKDEAEALSNVAYGLADKWPFSKIHNTKVEAKGCVKSEEAPKPPAIEV